MEARIHALSFYGKEIFRTVLKSLIRKDSKLNKLQPDTVNSTSSLRQSE